MRSDLELIRHNFPDDIMICPISDVHLGAIEHNKRAWDRFCEKVYSTENLYITLGGDLVNNNVIGSVGNPWEETMRPRDQKREMVNALKPIREKILCAVSGNHEKRRGNKDVDSDITYEILSKLDLEDLCRENMAFLKLCIGNRGKSKQPRVTFTMGVTHGSGGGIYTGATVNRNERFGNVIEGLDILCVGHTHKGTVTKPVKLVVDNHGNKVQFKSYTVISSESWMNYGGYAMSKMLLPSENANPQIIKLGGKHDDKKVEVIW